MKNTLFFLLALATFSAQATIRTVNNNPAGLAQFSDIQSAIDASASGDTIYVHGSISAYGGGTVTDKKLTIIGPGINPDKATSWTARVHTIQFHNVNTSDCNGSCVMGIEFYAALNISHSGSGNTGVPVNGMKVIRNKFADGSGVNLYTGNPYGSMHMYNLFVEGNYFEGGGVGAVDNSYFTNCTFINNVFARSAAGPWYLSFISNMVLCTNVVFDHNLFYVSPTAVKTLFFSKAMNMTFKNNIFVNVDNVNTIYNGQNVLNNTFQNNLTYNCVNNSIWTFANNVDLGGNISNQNPQMGSQAAVDAGTANPLLDFSIASGPANNAGTDGKDLGVLFDETSTMNWLYGRNSRLPYVHTMNVLNSSVPAGGTLNVQINARKAK
jgi:hypothetical protein